MQLTPFKKLLNDTRGETGFIEWMILVAVIAIFCLGAFKNIGTAINNKAGTKVTAINGLP
jgi:Flp pilus assembly pilin Flp